MVTGSPVAATSSRIARHYFFANLLPVLGCQRLGLTAGETLEQEGVDSLPSFAFLIVLGQVSTDV